MTMIYDHLVGVVNSIIKHNSTTWICTQFARIVIMPRIKSMARIEDFFNYKGREISVFLTFGMGSLGKNEIGNKFYYLIYYVIIVHLFFLNSPIIYQNLIQFIFEYTNKYD